MENSVDIRNSQRISIRDIHQCPGLPNSDLTPPISRPLSEIGVEPQQVPVRIGDDELSKTVLNSVLPIPPLFKRKVVDEAFGADAGVERRGVGSPDHEIHAAAERRLKRRRPEAAAGPSGLFQHEMRVAEREIGEALFRPLVPEFEADQPDIEA